MTDDDLIRTLETVWNAAVDAVTGWDLRNTDGTIDDEKYARYKHDTIERAVEQLRGGEKR